MTRTLPRRSATKAKEAREHGTAKLSVTNDGEGLLALDGYNSEEDEDWDPEADEGEEDIDMESSDDEEEEGKKKGSEQGTRKKVGSEQLRKGAAASRREGCGSREGGKEHSREGGDRKENGGGDGDDGGESDGDIKDRDIEGDGGEGGGESHGEGEDFGSEVEESSGGEGGQVKTRSQRAKLAKEKVPLATTQGATADVDKLWKSMNQQSWNKRPEYPTGSADPRKIDTGAVTTGVPLGRHKVDGLVLEDEQGKKSPCLAPVPDSGTGEKKMINGILYITISQTYTFAGITHTENKLVPADSAEARLFLSTHPEFQIPPTNSTNSPPPPSQATRAVTQKAQFRRPLKRASNYDSGLLHPNTKAQKMNTLDKSRLDWAGFVDKEGIKEELDRQGKGGGYVDRQAFLGRVDERRDGLLKEGLKKK